MPAATVEQVLRLQGEGYRLHRVWANGIEMRQGPEFRVWLLIVHVLVLILFTPAFWLCTPFAARNILGYRHRLLVLSSEAGEVRVV